MTKEIAFETSDWWLHPQICKALKMAFSALFQRANAQTKRKQVWVVQVVNKQTHRVRTDNSVTFPIGRCDVDPSGRMVVCLQVTTFPMHSWAVLLTHTHTHTNTEYDSGSGDFSCRNMPVRVQVRSMRTHCLPTTIIIRRRRTTPAEAVSTTVVAGSRHRLSCFDVRTGRDSDCSLYKALCLRSRPFQKHHRDNYFIWWSHSRQMTNDASHSHSSDLLWIRFKSSTASPVNLPAFAQQFAYPLFRACERPIGKRIDSFDWATDRTRTNQKMTLHVNWIWRKSTFESCLIEFGRKKKQWKRRNSG